MKEIFEIENNLVSLSSVMISIFDTPFPSESLPPHATAVNAPEPKKEYEKIVTKYRIKKYQIRKIVR